MTVYSILYTNGLGVEEEYPFPQLVAASAAVVVCLRASVLHTASLPIARHSRKTRLELALIGKAGYFARALMLLPSLAAKNHG